MGQGQGQGEGEGQGSGGYLEVGEARRAEERQ